MQPDISYIVSCFNRPHLLPRVLTCLACQTNQHFEVIVTDNANDDEIACQHHRSVLAMKDKRFRYFRTSEKIKVSDCYWSAEWAVKNKAKGRWYIFPCDDTLLAREFGQRMLAAAYQNAWDFVICGQAVVGPDASGGSGYRLWEMKPGRACKTTFMVRSDVFVEHGMFAGKPVLSSANGADYTLSWYLPAKGVKWGIVGEAMVIHE